LAIDAEETRISDSHTLGKMTEKLEIARKLRNKGVEIKLIADTTGLSEQEIKDL
jgi:uncharacterized NAD-dependent epimerase/dehydratase family protein